jgi:hypothetical protein
MSNVNVKSKYTNSIKSAVILVTLNTGTWNHDNKFDTSLAYKNR